VAFIPVDGFTRASWVSAIANIALPTTTELNAGILLTGTMTPDGLQNFQPDTADVPNATLASTFDTVDVGRVSYKNTALRLYKTTATDTIYNTLTKNTAGFVVVRRDIDTNTAWASSQAIEVYPAKCGETRRIDPASNEETMYEVPVKITSQPKPARGGRVSGKSRQVKKATRVVQLYVGGDWDLVDEYNRLDGTAAKTSQARTGPGSTSWRPDRRGHHVLPVRGAGPAQPAEADRRAPAPRRQTSRPEPGFNEDTATAELIRRCLKDPDLSDEGPRRAPRRGTVRRPVREALRRRLVDQPAVDRHPFVVDRLHQSPDYRRRVEAAERLGISPEALRRLGTDAHLIEDDAGPGAPPALRSSGTKNSRPSCSPSAAIGNCRVQGAAGGSRRPPARTPRTPTPSS
jgi:hypothetical protein